jgi:hypothetical protein
MRDATKKAHNADVSNLPRNLDATTIDTNSVMRSGDKVVADVSDPIRGFVRCAGENQAGSFGCLVWGLGASLGAPTPAEGSEAAKTGDVKSRS